MKSRPRILFAVLALTGALTGAAVGADTEATAGPAQTPQPKEGGAPPPLHPEITVPADWSQPEMNRENGIVAMATSPDGKRSALLWFYEIPPEELAVMPDPLAATAWSVKEAESEKGFSLKNEKKLETSIGPVMALTSVNKDPNRKERIQTFVTVADNTAILLRLATKGLEGGLSPGKDPALADILKSWNIRGTQKIKTPPNSLDKPGD